MSCATKTIFGIVCLVLQFIVFLFVLVATPIDVLRGPNSPWRPCYSMWGLKRCGNHGVDALGRRYKGFGCAAVRNTMNAAAAFAIFSIFLTLIGLVLTIVNVIGVFKTANIITIAVCAVAFVTILISWACIAGAKNQRCGGFQPLRQYDLYGGFGLLVTAWVLELAVCILIFFA